MTGPEGFGAGPKASPNDTRRIREVYAARDSRPARGPAIASAYREVNEERRAKTTALLRSLPGLAWDPAPRLLDVGCGSGLDLAELVAGNWPIDHLAGVDLVADRIAAARERCPGVHFQQVDGTGLPFVDGSFDVATAVTVFSSIPTASTRKGVFAEMERVVRPGGWIVVYDFVIRNPGNPNVVAMPMRCLREFAGRDAEVSRRLSPFLYLVALASIAGPGAIQLAMRLAPPTHRLTAWRRPG